VPLISCLPPYGGEIGFTLRLALLISSLPPYGGEIGLSKAPLHRMEGCVIGDQAGGK